MKHLQHLHKEFISMAERPMNFGALPIEPQEAIAPILPMDRWRESQGALYKTYQFRRLIDRDAFVMGLLSYERQTEHNADITIKHDTVALKLQTQDLGKVTSLDKEYARFADVTFKDLVYSSMQEHGNDG